MAPFSAPCRLQLGNSPVRRKALSERQWIPIRGASERQGDSRRNGFGRKCLKQNKRTFRQRGGKAVDELRSSWIQSVRPRRRGRATDTIERGRHGRSGRLSGDRRIDGR